MVAAFLFHYDAAGGETIHNLPLEGNSSTWYLPDEVIDDTITLSPELNHLHSTICLETHPDFVLLRVFDDRDGGCHVLADDGLGFHVPVSTSTHLNSFILHRDVQFTSRTTDRWAIRWDETGDISNSMRPSPLPTVSGLPGLASEDDAMEDVVKLVDPETEEAAKSDTSSRSTCSPTPSPRRDEPQAEIPGGTTESDDSILSKASTLVPTEREDQQLAEEKTCPTDHDVDVEGNTPAEHTRRSTTPPETITVATRHDSHESPERPPSIRGQQTGGLVSGNQQLTPASPSLKPSHTENTTSERQPRKRKLVDIKAGDVAQDSEEDDIFSTPNTQQAKSVSSSKTLKPGTARRGGGRATPKRKPVTVPKPRTVTPESHAGTQSSSPRKRARRDSVASSAKQYAGSAPIVIFSGSTEIDQKNNMMEAFRHLGGRETKSINDATMLCVGKGPLKRTSKLIIAVARGIDIVTEEWVTETQRRGCFPAADEFLPLDPSHERIWDFELKDAMQRGKLGLTHILSGTTVFLTRQIRTDLGKLERELSQVATVLGADSVQKRLPALKDKENYAEHEVLIIGAENDPQGAQVGRLGQKLYNKDILTMAVLRGKLERASAEFLIDVPVKDEEDD
ncbi:hypothetical protein LTR47_005829 [Exophiala xenobiotica]|nr:hypothetical protein LTR47_005829 [Exophiala xenobiotica]KAK5258950.1 hypothetical protein LTR40_006883 [Exophiala xenobiotica]KAK5350993.1 hypothetical protein LTR61_005346 [Exophiala xenobiotica]KAK5373973.1 hypothetical protein LTS03_006128 [Exophiala xenobiotica]KAK5374418.1 hypothetical protein LTR11_005625 [Exophiala xenobiotica]